MSNNTDTEQKCRECGCTDTSACYDPERGGGCYWVEADLCSACATDLQKKKAKAAIQKVIDQAARKAQAAPPEIFKLIDSLCRMLSDDKLKVSITETHHKEGIDTHFTYLMKKDGKTIAKQSCICMSRTGVMLNASEARWHKYVHNIKHKAIKELIISAFK